MKQFACLLIMTAFFFSCKSGKTNLQSDLTESNLKGKVWKIEKNIHNADAKVRCACGEREECNQTTYVYNEKGNLAESAAIEIDGKILITSRYIYDRDGACKEIDKYSGEKLVGKEVNILKGDKLMEVTTFDKNGVSENVCKYEYTGDDVSDGTTYNAAGEIVSFFHNEYLNGQLYSQTEKDKSGDITVITKYKRNGNNDVIESIFNNPKINGEYKLTFDYEYDKEGNWIKKTQLFNGKIAGVVMRNITYYNS